MVKIENESAFHAAIKDLRNGTDVNWVLASHIENQADQIQLVGSGSGGINELAQQLSDSNVAYGIVRVSQKIDLSVTTKFAYIYFIGENVPALLKGKIGSSHGEVKKLFSPYHIDFEITSSAEISEEILVRKLSENTGDISKVREVVQEEKATKTYKKPASSLPQASAGSGDNVAASSEVSQAIADVRNDKTETNWVVLAYQDNDLKKALYVVSTGNGGADELVSNFSADLIAYGFIRVVDVIEGIRTVKFVFITFIGSDVSIMKKAKVSTNKGSVAALFAPFHVTLEVTSTNEISDEILLTTVQEASGSKSKVK